MGDYCQLGGFLWPLVAGWGSGGDGNPVWGWNCRTQKSKALPGRFRDTGLKKRLREYIYVIITDLCECFVAGLICNQWSLIKSPPVKMWLPLPHLSQYLPPHHSGLAWLPSSIVVVLIFFRIRIIYVKWDLYDNNYMQLLGNMRNMSKYFNEINIYFKNITFFSHCQLVSQRNWILSSLIYIAQICLDLDPYFKADPDLDLGV